MKTVIEVYSAARLPDSSLHMLVPLNIIITIITSIPPSGLHCVGEMWGELDEGWLGGSSSRTLVHAGAWAFLPASCSSSTAVSLRFFSCQLERRLEFERLHDGFPDPPQVWLSS